MRGAAYDVPPTMRAAVLYDVDDIRIEERPVPRLEAGDVLVRAGASGVCSGDLMPWYIRKKAPFVFGHEPAGTVVAVGAGAKSALALGARVFAHHHAPCLRCAACQGGRFVHCPTWRATSLDPGGMAEYFRVPQANLADTLVLPEGLSFADGSLVEPTACVIKSLRRAFALDFERRGLVRPSATAGTLTGRTLYVIGAGVMGLLHVAIATALGARVFVSDFSAHRRDAALGLGARDAFEPPQARQELEARTGGRLADAVVCGPGTAAALAGALETVTADGTVVMFTPLEPGERFAFDQNGAYFRDVHLVASYSCGPADTVEALALIAGGVVTAKRLAVREYPFAEVDEAYRAMKAAEVIKAVITF